MSGYQSGSAVSCCPVASTIDTSLAYAPEPDWTPSRCRDRTSGYPYYLPALLLVVLFAHVSGVLGVSCSRFLYVYGLTHSVRYSFIAGLGISHGRGMVRLWYRSLQRYSTPLLFVFVCLLVIGACFGIL